MDAPIGQPFGANPAAYLRFHVLGHDGIDFPIGNGSPVHAVDAGTVVELGNDPGGFGLFVRQQTGQGTWLYAHLQSFQVSQGQVVAAGDVLALSNNTGNSTGPHLHLGFRPNGYDPLNGYAGYVDPAPLLDGSTTSSVPGAATPTAVALQGATDGVQAIAAPQGVVVLFGALLALWWLSDDE